MLNNENMSTQGEEHHILGEVAGSRGETAVGVRVGSDNIGRNARYSMYLKENLKKFKKRKSTER